MLNKDQIPCYRPPSKEQWTGRVDGPTPQRFHETLLCHDLSQSPLPQNTEEKICFALIGFSCDEGVSRNKGRIGAAEGPEAFRRAFANLPLPASGATIYDLGDILCEGGDLELSQESLGMLVAHVIDQNIFPIVIGGGHEVAWGHFQGLRRAYPTSKISVVNFDAHFDLRPLIEPAPLQRSSVAVAQKQLGSSGTSFTQIALDCAERNIDFDYTCFGIQPTGNTQSLFAKANELNVSYVTAQDLYCNPDRVAALTQSLQSNEKIYCTVCLDVFASAYAPSVSAPQPLGILPWHVLSVLTSLIQSGHVIALDVAELNPKYDVDNTTAKLASQIVATCIDSITKQSLKLRQSIFVN